MIEAESGTAYLVEPTNVTTTGTIQGKSLRCYEVDYTFDGDYRIDIKPTGKLFTVKNNSIICKPTKATLAGKYLHMYGRKKVVENQIDINLTYWGSTLLATPELAIAAKYKAISDRAQGIINEAEKSIRSINNTLAKQPDASFLLDDYPELFL